MSVSIDVLNQASLLIRSDATLSIRLREVLTELYELPEYGAWLDDKQFAGRKFRIPRAFISPEPRKRRLLEGLRFVVDDILQVKVNLLEDGLIFLTDGLFTPGEFRVFPWVDESNHLLTRLARENWSSWATSVVDVATGCGHSAIRSDVDNRVGMDISVRAISFANLNAMLNGRPLSLLAVNDSERNLPLLGGVEERTVFLVNMPFAIEPVPESLVRTAAGGENGYEKTLNVLHALDRYMKKARQHEVRAIVLTYSVGSKQQDRWVVPDAARSLFGSHSVDWEILTDEPLWRINGKKEQPNPMPLINLKLKADCRYYVRDPDKREPLRAGYVRKERELRSKGFDSLAYGVLTIDSTTNPG